MGKSILSIPHLALFFIVSILLPIIRGDLVDDVCKSSPFPELCIPVLRADPGSSKADVSGLALIVVETIGAKSVSVINEINELMESSPSLIDALTSCAESYDTILTGDIPLAKEALLEGDPKFAEDAVADAGVEVLSCQEGFAPSESPLTDSNDYVNKLCAVADYIIVMLL